MAPDKLTSTDPRVQHHHAILNGQSYHYLLATPSSTPRATVFSIHGWPDFSFGWRYQIPFLLSMNLRVVAPDMMGYGQTSAPEPLEFYTFKRAADDMAELAKHLNVPNFILLGHDWGGSIVYRIAMWYPKLITAVISICTPYDRPGKQYRPLDQVVKTLPNFTYQVQLASGIVESKIHTKEQIRQFLNAMYGGRGPNREVGFVVEQGLLFDNLPLLDRNRLLSDEELDYYTENYARNGLRGPLNWYRTRELNYKDEKVLAEDQDLKIRVPVLFVAAKHDAALPEHMSRGMERSFTELTRKEVDSAHWALWQRPEECNGLIGEFLEGALAGTEKKAML